MKTFKRPLIWSYYIDIEGTKLIFISIDPPLYDHVFKQMIFVCDYIITCIPCIDNKETISDFDLSCKYLCVKRSIS